MSFCKHTAYLKLGSRIPIKCESMKRRKRTTGLSLCHLAVPMEGSKQEKELNRKMKKIQILHAPHQLGSIFLEMCFFSFMHCIVTVSCKIKDYENSLKAVQ